MSEKIYSNEAMQALKDLPEPVTRWTARDQIHWLAGYEAALASRPPAPAWTSEPPKVPGWYWWKRYQDTGIDWFEADERLAPGRRIAGPIPEPPE